MNRLKEIFLTEKESHILWLPVFFAIGIAIYFSLSFEPNIRYSIAAFLGVSVAAFFARKSKEIFWIIIIIQMVIGGFLCAGYRSINVAAPILQKETGVRKVSGTLKQIHSLPHGQRFIVENPNIERLEESQTPHRIRFNVNTNPGGAKIGDIVSALVVLSPPPKPVIPGGYDFARHVYFQGIGAVGYAVSKVEVVKAAQGLSFSRSVNRLRQLIVTRVQSAMEKENGNIAAALLVGERGGISKKTLEDIRAAGVAHILAISGMHLSLVVAIFFFFSRAVFACVPSFAINYNIKKWAAYIAIFGSLGYLLISGAPISAQRAFVMTSLILIAIIIDRTGTPMRSIALAAMIVLLITPESLMTPSFQMSFAAVIALISGFEFFKPKLKEYSDYTLPRRFMLYVSGMVLSSLIAGMATAPFAAYHFNNFSSYGVFANLVAIPITSFLVMPSGVLALLLMPFGLEVVGLVPMGWGINIITDTSNYIANLPQATSIVPQFSNVSLGLVVFGGLWLCLWKTRWRAFAIIPIISSACLMFFVSTPDFIINETGKLFAAKSEQGQMIFSSNRAERYTKERWIENFAMQEISFVNKVDIPEFRCDEMGCVYRKKGHKISIAKHPIALREDCAGSDVLINLTYIRFKCEDAESYINKWNLKNQGAHVIYFDNGVKVESVASRRGERPWVR